MVSGAFRPSHWARQPDEDFRVAKGGRSMGPPKHFFKQPSYLIHRYQVSLPASMLEGAVRGSTGGETFLALWARASCCSTFSFGSQSSPKSPSCPGGWRLAVGVGSELRFIQGGRLVELLAPLYARISITAFAGGRGENGLELRAILGWPFPHWSCRVSRQRKST